MYHDLKDLIRRVNESRLDGPRASIVVPGGVIFTGKVMWYIGLSPSDADKQDFVYLTNCFITSSGIRIKQEPTMSFIPLKNVLAWSVLPESDEADDALGELDRLVDELRNHKDSPSWLNEGSDA